MSRSETLTWAFPVAANGSVQQTKSATDGSFVLEGLSHSHYSFNAHRIDLGRAELNDVDPAAAALVIAFAESKGTGAIHGTVKGFAEGSWTFGSVTSDNGANAMIRRDGTYRIEKIPAGEVALRAIAMSGGNQVSVGPVKATVAASEDIEVNLALGGDLTMRGTVTEGGQPRRQRYSTRYPLSGSTTFDIAIDYAQLQGRAVDEAGAPQSGVQIEVKSSDAEYGKTVATDAAGAFAVTVNEGRHYLVSATKKGFATWVQSVDDTRTPVVITLVRSAGLRVRLTDARDGKTLPGYVIATNAAGLIAARAGDQEKDGGYPVFLPAGAYRVSISANGYASQSARVSVPMQGELRLTLTPAATSSSAPSAPRAIWSSSSSRNGIAEIRLTGTTTTIDHIAPGRYTMQVLDADGRIKTSYPVTVEEGQTTIAEIHVPE